MSQAEPPWREALDALAAAYAPATLLHVRRQFRAFEAWCAEAGLPALPATPQVVAAHIDAVHPRYRRATMTARLGAIRKVHGLFDLPDPVHGRLVYLALRRGRRAYGGPPRQARAVTAVLKARLLAAATADLTGARDRVMLNLAYDTLCRSAEVVAFRVEDVTPLADGTAKLHIRAAKNDPFSEGGAAFVSAATHSELQAWLEAARITAGPILRRVWKDRTTGGRMDPSILGRRIRHLATQAGLPPHIVRQLSGHSLRVGGVQDHAAAGRTLLEIMRAGRWRGLPCVARYAREATINIWAEPNGASQP